MAHFLIDDPLHDALKGGGMEDSLAVFLAVDGALGLVKLVVALFSLAAALLGGGGLLPFGGFVVDAAGLRQV
jgi:hypothetical protein